MLRKGRKWNYIRCSLEKAEIEWKTKRGTKTSAINKKQ